MIKAHYTIDEIVEVDNDNPEHMKYHGMESHFYESHTYYGYIIDFVDIVDESIVPVGTGTKTEIIEHSKHLVKMLVRKEEWEIVTLSEVYIRVSDKDATEYIKAKMNANRL